MTRGGSRPPTAPPSVTPSAHPSKLPSQDRDSVVEFLPDPEVLIEDPPTATAQHLTPERLDAIANALTVGDYITIDWRCHGVMDTPEEFVTWIGKVTHVTTENGKPLAWITYKDQANSFAFPPRSTDTLIVEVRRCENKGRPQLRSVPTPDLPVQRPREELSDQGPLPQRTRTEQKPEVAHATNLEDHLNFARDIFRMAHPEADANGVVPVIRALLNTREDLTNPSYRAFYMFHILRNVETQDVERYVNEAMNDFHRMHPFMPLETAPHLRDQLPFAQSAYIAALIDRKKVPEKTPDSKSYYQPVFAAMSHIITTVDNITKGNPSLSQERLYQQWKKGLVDVAAIFDEIFSSRAAAGVRVPGKEHRQQHKQGNQHSKKPEDGTTTERICRYCHATIKLKIVNGRANWKEHTCCASKTH